MEFKKIIKCFGLGLTSACLLVGCTVDEQLQEKEEEKKIETKCEIKECIKEIKTSNTIEEINEIIGIEGEKSSTSESYTWKFSDKESIEASIVDNKMTTRATIDKSTIASDKVDFSVYNDIKKLLDKGKSLNYDEMVEKLGGVEGTLAGKTTTSERYIWVDKNNRSLR